MIYLAAVALMLPSSWANAACIRPEDRTASKWASLLVRTASVIVDAEVIQEQDVEKGERAVVRPLTVYKGSPNDIYTMSLPRTDGHIITESYAGFSAKLGERRLLILHQRATGYETNPCDEFLLNNQAVRAAVIRRTGH